MIFRPVVIVMAKAPRAREVKTRLVPPLSAEMAAALAACFVRDTCVNALRVVPEVIVAYSPADARAVLEPILPGGLIWLGQKGGDLGARLSTVAADARALGFSPLVTIGSDSPTLPAAYVGRAIEILAAREADVTLGPTRDGGFYLVGTNEPAEGLFQNIEWSTPRAYSQTAGNAARLGLRLQPLPSWYDVDTSADLLRLRDEILADREARRRAPHTSGWLLAHRHALPA